MDIIRGVLTAISISVGGYMIFDGLHEILTGTYFGPGLGPWSQLIMSLGGNPMEMGPVFVTLGALWLIFTSALLMRAVLGWIGGVAVSLGTVWYLPFGTILSVIYLVVLIRYRARLLQRKSLT